jgi:rubrerythrin
MPGIRCWVLGAENLKPNTPPRASALNTVGKGYKLIAMTTQQDVYICDVCGAEMLEIHCKIICPRCGFMRDCSDP